MKPHYGENGKSKNIQWDTITCVECGGCITCPDSFCVYNVSGDRGACYPQSCTYCQMYYRKNRLFLNNVG